MTAHEEAAFWLVVGKPTSRRSPPPSGGRFVGRRIPFSKLGLHIVCATGAFATLMASAQAVPASRTGRFDEFFSALATSCEPSSGLKNLLDDLVEKYIHDPGKHENMLLRIPSDLKSAFSAPVAKDNKKWVAISLFVTGSFHGLTLKEFKFDAGRDNDIFIFSLVFRNRTSELREVLGPQIRKWDQKLTAAARAGRSDGIAPDIRADGPDGSQLVCEPAD